MTGKIQVPSQLDTVIGDRVNVMDPARREQFTQAMTKLNDKLSSMTVEERHSFMSSIEDLRKKTDNGEELTIEDLEAVSGGIGWQAIGVWVSENLDWNDFKQGVVDAWNET